MVTSSPSAAVVQRGKKYILSLDGFPGRYRVHYAAGPAYDEQVMAAEAAGGSTTLKAPTDKRLLFSVSSEAGRAQHTATRLVEGAGISNLRDLGGYAAQDGRRVRWGLLYRGAGPYDLNRAEQQYLQSLGLGTVFDLRSRAEVADAPDMVPQGAEYLNVSGIPAMDEGEDMAGNLNMQELVVECMKNPEMLAYMSDYLPNAYRIMARRTEAFARLFATLLAKPGQPILFHCSAGKDRTGMSAACILRVLGVPHETVMQDYLLSNEYRAAVNRRLFAKMRLVVHKKEVFAVLKQSLEVRAGLLQSTFDLIDEEYGGFEAFAHKSLGLTDGDIETLRGIYLE